MSGGRYRHCAAARCACNTVALSHWHALAAHKPDVISNAMPGKDHSPSLQAYQLAFVMLGWCQVSASPAQQRHGVAMCRCPELLLILLLHALQVTALAVCSTRPAPQSLTCSRRLLLLQQLRRSCRKLPAQQRMSCARSCSGGATAASWQQLSSSASPQPTSPV